MSAASEMLKKVEARIEELLFERNILREVVAREMREARAANVQNTPVSPEKPVESNLSDLRPTNAKNTYAILDAVRRYPTKTLSQITEILVKETGADADKKRQLYATGYGLIRRGRIQKDKATGGLTTTFSGTEADLEGGG